MQAWALQTICSPNVVSRKKSYYSQHEEPAATTVAMSSLHVLRHHGMTEAGLHAVFLTVVVSRLTYASPAWSGFITATDRQRADAFLRRRKRCGFCPPDLPEFDELPEKSDDELFNKTINNPNHTLHQFLPPQSGHRSTTTLDTVPTMDYYQSVEDNCLTAILS